MKERVSFIIAVALTVVWLAVAGVYLAQLSWDGLMALKPGELGALLTAIAGPVAALWLIAVVLEQRRDARVLMQRLSELVQQERRTQQQAETLARAVTEIQGQTARAMSAETRALALQDLAANAALLGERLGVVKRDAAGAAWARFGAGDTAVFVQAFLNFAGSHPDIAERIGEAAVRDPSARVALAGFVRRYEEIAAAVDDKLMRAVIEDGALGRGYRLFKQADEFAAMAASPPPAPDSAQDPLDDRLEGLSRRLATTAPEA